MGPCRSIPMTVGITGNEDKLAACSDQLGETLNWGKFNIRLSRMKCRRSHFSLRASRTFSMTGSGVAESLSNRLVIS